MKLKDLISTLLDYYAACGDVEVKINAFDVERVSSQDQLMMVPADVSGYNEEFDCIELF